MKKKILNGLLIVTLMGGAMTSFVSCKDVEADLRTEIEAGVTADFEDVLAKLETERAALQAQVDALKTQVANCEANCSANATTLNNLKAKVEELEGKIAQLDDLKTAVENLKNANESLEARMTTLEEALKNFKGGLSEAEVKALIETYLKEWLTEDQVKELLKDYVTTDDLAKALKPYVTDEQLGDSLTAFLNSEELENKVQEIIDAQGFVTDEELETRLADFLENEVMPAVDVKLATLKEEITTMLHNVLASMITGIEINAVVNPIFGTASLPADIRTTVLGAYYGKTAAAVRFPDAALSAKLQAAGINLFSELWDADELLFEDAYGNAGKVYLTINPNTVDFNGQYVELVTSQNNPSPIKLDAVYNSDKELSFGYMRGGAENGFYEASAYLSADDLDDVKLKLNINELKDAAKEALSQRSKTSVVKLATTLLTDASNIFNVPAYGVKATWTEDLENGETTDHSVLSQYAIAATAIKPLSYDFMKGVSYDIPGLERFENLIGRAIDKVVNEIKNAIPEIGDMQLGDITIGVPDEDDGSYEIEITLDPGDFKGTVPAITKEVTLYDEDGHEVKGTITIEEQTVTNNEPIKIKYNFYDDFKRMFGDINLDELQSVLDNLSGLTNLGSDLDNMGNELKDKIFNFLDRLNSKFRSLTGSINSALQPCLLFSDANGNVHRVTTATTGTQVTGSAIVLAPTSYTAELFAPAYKKFIAVTGVTGNHTKSLAELNSSENFGKVIPGSVKTVTLEGLESGCTYEITYSALDYAGVTCTKTYYVSVK